jgi:hypothetical protein
MNKLKPLVPALVSFGPIFMVMGTTQVLPTVGGQIIAYAGAVMLTTGCLYPYKIQ